MGEGMKSDDTRKALELALRRIQLGRTRKVAKGRKMSIAAVAEEAGFTPATIHNGHFDIAEKIRGLTQRTARERGEQKSSELQKVKARLRETEKENAQLAHELAGALSANECLRAEIGRLSGLKNSGNVVPLTPRS